MIEHLRLRNYSELSIRSYICSAADFARYFNIYPGRLGRIRSGITNCISLMSGKLPGPLQVPNAALKFLYTQTLKQSWFVSGSC